MELVEYAQRYAAKGYKVFPLHTMRGTKCSCGNPECESPAKHPRTRNGSHEATSDPAKIAEFWRKYPNSNIGMTLDGLVVVDIDPRNGGSADNMLPNVLTPTCFARTGSGGSHHLYRAKPGVRYDAKPYTGIDLKFGPGQYIVVEPSMHESGQRYCWLDESEPWAMQPAEAPEWLPVKREAAAPSAPAPHGSIPAGGRNQTLTSMAGAMRRKGVSAQAIEAALLEENKRCSPPLPTDEVKKIAWSIGRYAPEPEPEHEAPDPLPEVISPSETLDDLMLVYRNGLGRGDSTGFPILDQLLSFAMGQVTVLTGWPSHGKSQFLDNILAYLTSHRRWFIDYCSMENMPVFLHVEKIAKLWTGKPLRRGPTERMSEDELRSIVSSLDERLRFLQPHEEKPNPSIPEVLQSVENDFRARGLWGVKDVKLACVLDPWNEFEHVRPKGYTLTEYCGEMLSRIRQWARRNNVHAFIVGHPSKQRRMDDGKLPVPQLDMISDSAHFWNKADNGLVVHRPDTDTQDVDIYVQKVRFAHIGKQGMCTLKFDITTGRYHDPNPQQPHHDPDDF